MPVISRENYPLHDEEAKKRGWDWRKKGFQKVTTYSSKNRKRGGFQIKLPDYMEGVLGKSIVWGHTQDEVDKAFNDRILEYNIRIASKRKVILYSILANVDTIIDGKAFNIDTLGLYSDKQKYSTGLAIWSVVCWETKTERGGFKYYDDKGYSVSKPSYKSHYEVIDYSPEREAFFKALSEQIALMVYNADNFLKEKKKLLELIDSSRALPFFKETKAEEREK